MFRRALGTPARLRLASLRRSFTSTPAAAVSKDLPLAGVRVLDLTRVLAGPYSTMLLGDLGAEVIKIENPSGGDDTREWGPPFFDPARPGPLTPAVVEYRKRLQNPYDLAALSSPVPAHVTESDPHAANAAPPATSGTAVRGEAAYFLALNRNKRSMAVDLKSTRGKQLILDLATVSDVVVENYIPGKLDALGIGYSALSAVNPNLIFASISGYGATGPMRETAGYDVMASSLGGLLGVTGSPDAPARPGAAVTDVITGLNTLSAVLAALLAQRTRRDARRIAELDATVAALAAGAAPGAAAEAGALAAAAAAGAQGCRIRDGFVIDGARLETSLIEAQVAALANIAQVYLASGVVSQRRGTAHGSIVPYQCFPITANAAAANATTDAAAPTASAAAAAPAAVASEPAAPPRFIAVGALNNKQFQLLVGPAGLDLPAVAADPRFATNPARVRHQAALLPLLTARLGELDPGATMAALAAAGVPVAPVLTVGETLNHPQVLQREMVQFVDYPQARSSHAGVGTGTTVGGSTGGDSGEAAQRTPLLALCGPAVKMFRTTAPVDDAASDATDLAETRLDLRARLPPPFLAQHTEEVLAEVLRLSATEIEVLKNDHIVAQHPRWTQAAGASDKPSK